MNVHCVERLATSFCILLYRISTTTQCQSEYAYFTNCVCFHSSTPWLVRIEAMTRSRTYMFNAYECVNCHVLVCGAEIYSLVASSRLFPEICVDCRLHVVYLYIRNE